MGSATIRSQTMRATGLVITLIVGAFLALALSLGQAQIYALGRTGAREQAQAIVARAQPAVIAGAVVPTAAQDLLGEIVGHDGILAGALYTGSATPVATLEARPATLNRCPRPTRHGALSAVTDVVQAHGFWCVLTPVFLRRAGRLCTQHACVLGGLLLAISNRPTRIVASHLILATSVMSVMLLLAAMASLWWVAERISAPLNEIVGVMREFSPGKPAPTAKECAGPEETRTIARVYNRLLEQQASEARILEERVAQRTRELQEATREVQQSERYRTAFVVQMSHEMRTPLHLIQAQASEALHELEFWRDGQNARNNISLILQESDELANRVDQVLSLVRSGESQEPVHLEPTRVERLCEYLLAKYRPLAERKHNTITVEADDVSVELDQDKVMQILNNLVDNSCKYTSDGAIHVSLRAQDDRLRICVEDTGTGIPPDKLEEVWKEFRQAPSPLGARPDGFGLGLAIVSARTTQLGGTCSLQSLPGKGTTVIVSLPAKALPDAHNPGVGP
ncbi:MAG: sensor histidine kinase [Steroidobacteraceae bacterium]